MEKLGKSEYVGSERPEGNAKMLALIILMGMTPPLASDLYMPGMPAMTQELGTSPALATHTMTVFFLLMAVGTLVVGPICDRYGRKPVRIVCTALSCAACLGCALAPSIGVLLFLRGVHGLGGGGMLSISTTLVKDCYAGDRMAKVLGFVQAASMVMPIVAPLLGAALFGAFGWRGLFVFIALVVAATLVLCITTPETAPELGITGEGGALLDDFKVLLKNKSFVLPIVSGGFFLSAFNAYLGNASFVYQDFFGLSATQFGIIFSITSVACITGALLYTRLTRVKIELMMKWIYIICGISAVALAIVGETSPYAFMACIIVMLLCLSLVRPMLTNYVLQPLARGIGSASALLNFIYSAVGCVGMFGATLGIGSVVFGVQSTVAVSLAISLAFWIAAMRAAR